ncbi:hypothetical protein Anas_09797 [Armadillidium nasatum]|uniref:Uncharacterized protein n=1 Tax=Armadillidium nasatum TaxID=96803 RepID=A0A5N5SIA9_9CRUS|nr:hypothetical protein Anas_09797 [Armadillidium nasatum]
MSFYNSYVLYVIVTLVICIVRRDTAVGSTETPIDPKTIVTQEGFRDDVRTIKTKVKDKVNSTITSTKDKVKQKVKDKVQKKIEEKLDPTGGYLKLPAIIGIAVAVVVLLIISCIVCCCCCPYCILYKRRQARNEKYEPAEVHLQPLRKTDDYNLVTSQDYNNENGTCNIVTLFIHLFKYFYCSCSYYFIIQLEYTRSLICIIININM